jgi:hypothetical protein
MAEAQNDYRLVIFEEPDDPLAVRDLLCGVTGIHPTDAMQWVARTPGIWPRPLAEGETRELLDGLAGRSPAEPQPAAHHPRRRLPARRLPHPGAARRADPLAPLGEGRAR